MPKEDKSVAIPESVHDELKLAAAQHKTSMKELLVQFIRDGIKALSRAKGKRNGR